MSRPARSRPAVAWLQLLLVGTMACVVLILAEAMRAARSSATVAEHALRDYSNFAAWSYRQHLTTRLREAVDELLGPVNHGQGMHSDPRIPSAADMGHMIRWDETCLCHRPRRGPLPARFLAFKLGSDTLAVGLNFSPNRSQGWLGDPPMGMGMAHTVPALVFEPNEKAWINRLLTVTARKPRSEWGYNVMVARYDTTLRFFASRSMPTSWGDTIVYAAEYPVTALDSLFGVVLATTDLLPPSLVAGRTNRDILDVEVADGYGTPVFASRYVDRWELDAKTRLPNNYGGLQVRAQLRPDLASALLIGGMPQSRVPLLLTILVLTMGLAIVTAVQLRREVRFATERANFVANVSHELRTPLTQVRLVLDTLRLGRGGDAQSRDRSLGIADREVLRLQHLVEGVLRFTRRTNRKDEPVVRADAAREARLVASEFQPLATPRDVRIEVTGDETVTASLQNGALRQVLLNLLDNAVKYGRDGSTVTVDVRQRSENGGGVRVAVSDSGPGVPGSERERIWRPFTRGGAAKQRAAGGSGIGLTIVREIAGEHAGRAWVEDAPGGGARFVVDLPDVER